jgi:hypothetical protein
MLRYVLERGHYREGILSPGEAVPEYLLAEGIGVDWVFLLSSAYYMPGAALEGMLRQLASACRKGMILSLDGITEEFWQAVQVALGEPLTLLDHRPLGRQIMDGSSPLSACWECEVLYQGFAWQSPLTGLDIHADLVRLTPRN